MAEQMTGAEMVIRALADQGVEHIFQVVTNFLSGPTNPYNIHEILLQQKPSVVPGYDFTFAARMHA